MPTDAPMGDPDGYLRLFVAYLAVLDDPGFAGHREHIDVDTIILMAKDAMATRRHALTSWSRA